MSQHLHKYKLITERSSWTGLAERNEKLAPTGLGMDAEGIASHLGYRMTTSVV